MSKLPDLSEAAKSEVIEMALSDHIAFADIKKQHGLSEKQVKELMRENLKPGSYKAWRKRVRTFGSRREHYK
ncbi:TIGR03643 family protein [Cognatiyoonia koreensis]|uniref:TIGR03643 family protein n=1 Tax=Cognatiyoonia koreensis TaxID=364200 RepID=A0A1I0RFD7_9RHOB|nr:TIGR03643 family protein [Cognatiyoonia koreensis]SEW39480.1 TIGR03643 family protein [Cognatiyoonia koreensis]